MSQQDYEVAKQRISISPKKPFFSGEKPLSLIEKAEKRLGVKFPPLYISFILEYGAGGIGTFEIYGLTGKEFDTAGIPDVVWYTEKARNEWGLPSFLIPIYELGNGEIHCLDLRTMRSDDEEASVVAINPPYPGKNQALDLVAEDFGEFLIILLDIEQRI